MKKMVIFIILIQLFCLNSSVSAQQKKNDLEELTKELETSVVNEAKLTQQEAQAFLPIFRDMIQKRRELFEKQKRNQRSCAADDKSALEVLKKIECTENEIIEMQKCYHSKALKVIPASKLLLCIKAEDKFKRIVMKRIAEHKRNHKKKEK